MAKIKVTTGEYVRPGLGINNFKYVGDIGPTGGFLTAFIELTAPIQVDLKAGTAAGDGMTSTGLKYVRYVSATQGDDVLKGGDVGLLYQGFIGNGGDDDIDGRGGFDYVMYDDEEDYGAATEDGWANGFEGVVVDLVQGTAKDSYGDTDTLKNIEGVIGTSFADRITGNSSANHLVGQEGKDKLSGGGGNDSLVGGNGPGNTPEAGGDGRDTLTGGRGEDVFVFRAVADSRPSSSKRDYITDFKHGADDIDVSAIDAKTKDGDQKFTLDEKGTADTAVKMGHIGWYQVDKSGSDNDRTILQFNVNGDDAIEMQIELKGLVELTKGDFIL